MKILINMPDIRHIHGGVTNHYIGLRNYWTENVIYNCVGKRREGANGAWWLPWDYIKFIFLCIFRRPDIVLVNPSMNSRAWRRDRLFVRIARMCGRKVAIMFHGWTSDYAESLPRKQLVKDLNKASVIFVLASDFKRQIESWGVTTPVVLTTTKVTDTLLDGFNISRRDGRLRHFLFLSRILKEKGIYETLDTFSRIVAEYPDATLTVAGDGAELEPAKAYSAKHKIPNVTFTGHIDGKDKVKALAENDFYFLPSTYGEGMPTSVLEAMAFGMPVLTRPVGGLHDFFEDGRMGIFTESLDPELYYKRIQELMKSPEKVKEISHYNYNYAKNRFLASAVAQNMQKTLESVL